jgi:adenine-specific DNA methylase
VGEDQGEPLRLRLDDDYRDSIGFHRWFATRGTNAARAAVAFTTSPDWLNDPGKLDLMASGDDAAIASAIAQGRSCRNPGNADSHDSYLEERLLDLCAGIGTVGAMASRLGFDALSVELSIVPHLIDRVLHDFSVSLAKGSSSSLSADQGQISSWRGFVTEVEEFANAVWSGAKERLKELFEEDVDIRLWLRIAACPSCERRVPVLSNVRLSRDTALNVSPGPAHSGESQFPRFGLLRTEFDLVDELWSATVRRRIACGPRERDAGGF